MPCVRGLLTLAAAALLAVVLAGCGLGTASGGHSDVQLVVTRDFGSRPVLQTGQPALVGAETALGLLARTAQVRTDPGGEVRSIAGLVAHPPARWTLFVNGVLTTAAPGTVALHPGDRLWWDLRDATAAPRVPAVVGDFPAPFDTGTGGKRLPVSVECGLPGSKACAMVGRALLGFGVPAGQGAIGSAAGARALRVLVGPWPRLSADPGVTTLERGPRESGVFARISPDGATILTLDGQGRVARRLGPGTGLVATSRLSADQPPFWIVTGTDGAGLDAAASAFAQGESTLGQHYALAIAGGQGVPLPVVRPGR